jgi:Ca2+-binding EF-hand superfamily protein
MTIGSIGGTTAGDGSVSTTQAVDQLFKKADSDSDGKITKSELTQAGESDSVEISSSGREMSVEEVFNLLDTGDKGYITKQDAASGLEKLQSTSGGAAATGGAGKPAGGGGGGGGGSASATTDPADTNEDGTVSLQEELAYMLKQYAASSSDQQVQTQSAIYA